MKKENKFNLAIIVYNHQRAEQIYNAQQEMNESEYIFRKVKFPK